MDVAQIFSQLSTGPLSNLSIGGEGSGEIALNGRTKLTNYLNASLRKLHSRFLLREQQLILEMSQGRTKYHLLAKHGTAYKLDNPDSVFPVYIQDTLSPYQNDLIKVLEVFDSHGHRMPLNDSEQSHSVFTPTFNTLQIPDSGDIQAVSVLYQANHPTIPTGDLSIAVELPEALHAALQHDIAAQVFSHMNGSENSMKGQEYMANFEMECAGVVDNDLVNNSISQTNVKFNERGFV